MRIKRLLMLALCALMATLLVSCSEQPIGDYLKNYDYQPEIIEDVTLDLYIVVGDETASNAIITIQEAINKHTTTKYHTTLNINYVKASEYDTTVVEAVNTGKADIVLITSTELMNTFTEAGKLADLAAYLDTTDFGKLNTLISDALLEGAYNADGKLYSIPNDHVIGNYEYVKINTAIAQGVFNYNDDRLAEINTPEEVDAFWQEIEAKLAFATTTYQKSEVVQIVSGNYQDKAVIEAEGWVCNVYMTPVVDADEVNEGAFAVTTSCKKPERAMEIIYALSTDSVLRNLLLYGEEGKNYTVDTNGYVVPVESGENVYRMEIRYTGSYFNAHYTVSDLFGFAVTEELCEFGELQNADAVLESNE